LSPREGAPRLENHAGASDSRSARAVVGSNDPGEPCEHLATT
jgi:hypothetical protein